MEDLEQVERFVREHGGGDPEEVAAAYVARAHPGLSGEEAAAYVKQLVPQVRAMLAGGDDDE